MAMTEIVSGFWFGLGFAASYCALNWLIYLTVNTIKERRWRNEQKRNALDVAGFAAAEIVPEQVGSKPH